MLGDFYTKPIQGSLYQKFRNSILGISETDYVQYQHEYNEAKNKLNDTR